MLLTFFIRLTLGAFLLAYAAEFALGWGLLGGTGIASWGIEHVSEAHRKERVEIARRFGVDMDTRGRGEVVADLHAQNIDAVPSVMTMDVLAAEGVLKSDNTLNHGELLPLGGVSGALTVLCNESGQYVTYRSDEHGFSNPGGVWNAGHADLAAVGQSHLQGYCVEPGKTFVDLLRGRFSHTLNLGNSGEASVLQLAAIREYLPSYAPKVVLWIFSEGLDLPDLYDESLRPFVMQYLDPAFSQGLIARQPEIDAALRPYLTRKERRDQQRLAGRRDGSIGQKFLRVMKLWDLRERLQLILGHTDDYRNGFSVLETSKHSLFGQILAQAQSTTESWGGTLYVVYLPSWSRYVNGSLGVERERRKVLDLATALGIHIIDVQPAFQAHPDPLSLFWFRRSVHFNDAGQQLIAETILKDLSQPGNGASRASADPGHD